MCSHGDTVIVPVTIDALLSFEGRPVIKEKPIDRCIAPIVTALEQAGIFMFGSCCGHGKFDGEIFLVDGRTLIVRSGPELTESYGS